MKNSYICLSLAIAQFFASAAFGAAYMKIEGIDGESKSAAHKGWIDIESVSGIVATRDAATGLATGKRQHKPITITKRIDKASPLLRATIRSAKNPQHEAKSKKANNPLHTADTRQANNPLYTSGLMIEQDGNTYQLRGITVLSSERNDNTETVKLSYKSIKVLPKATTGKRLKAKAAPATSHNASRSNRSSSE